jgi:Peptidase family S41
MRTRLNCCILMLFAFASATSAQSTLPSGPMNLGFEEGESGGLPPGWQATTARGGVNPGYVIQLTREKAKQGTYCVELAAGESGDRGPFGNLMQHFVATAYRGTRVRFRAAVRTEGPAMGGRAQLWLRVDRPGGDRGFFDNMGDRPITSNEWQYYEIVGDIESDAVEINIGVILLGAGKLWIDDASFEVLGETPKVQAELARPLTQRGLQNEIAFARLYGLVRYFHPSDQAARTDWESFAIQGARAVENAKDDAELAQKLASLFSPVAPTVRVLTGEQKYVLPPELQPPKDAGEAKVTYWRHRGVGISMHPGGTYHSERVQEKAAGADGKKVPAPGSPWQAGLSDGVRAWVPITLYVDAQGTLPHMASASASDADKAMKPGWTGNDRGTRLADVIIAWNIFEHFYPYFDVVKTDWSATLPKSLQAAAVDADETIFADTLRHLVADLHDGHGGVYKGGPVALLPVDWAWIEGKLVVTTVGAGVNGRISAGDAVVSINGRPVADVLAARESMISGATPQWVRWNALRELLRGPKDQTAKLVVEPFAQMGTKVEVALRYEDLSVPVEEHRPAKIAETEPGIFYVDIGRVSDADFQAAIPQLEKAHGIIFDFRGYPSKIGPAFLTHLTDKTMTSAQWHVPLALWPDHKDVQFERGGEWDLKPAQPLFTAKKAFITDGRAISYAESCMGIVEYYKLGAIVGAPTAGTNGNVNPFTLPGGYAVSWTGMKVLKHDGSRHHGVGILPTVPVARTRAGVAAGRDELLERAVSAVR